MISPEIQRDEISRYCDKKGWEVSEWFQDLDLSGRAWDRKKRKGLDDAIARVNEASEGLGSVWWTTAVRSENGEQVEEFEVFTEFIVRLTHLQRKNEAPLTNLSRRFASSQLMSK